MPGFLRSRWFWIIVVLVALVLGGGLVLKSQAKAKKKAMEAAAASAPVSPYAAIGNGKADVEGGIIQVAARRSGIVKEVYVQEGDVTAVKVTGVKGILVNKCMASEIAHHI